MNGSSAPTSALDQFTAPTADLLRRVADLERAATRSDSPTGAMMEFAGATSPTGWLICNGASLLRAAYPALFAVIGVAWGAVDGTHFTLPDMRGRTPIGAGTGTGLSARTLAANVGAETHTLSAAESGLVAHHHGDVVYPGTLGGTDSRLYGDYNAAAGAKNIGYANVGVNWTGGGAAAYTQSKTPEAASASHNNMQPSAVVNFIIRT